MLRYAFLPSDFHPQFLILGERKELFELVSILRNFAATPRTVAVSHQSPAAAEQDVHLSLCPGDPEGLRRRDGAPKEFEWRLNSAAATSIADLIETTLESPDPAGSVMLELQQPDEIPVKVSYGEFTDGFLIEDF